MSFGHYLCPELDRVVVIVMTTPWVALYCNPLQVGVIFSFRVGKGQGSDPAPARGERS